jgi:hypothetical protein
VRTRTVLREKQTHQFLGTFGGPGNGDSRGELRRATQVITSYAATLGLPPASVLLRLDGMSGDAAPLIEVLTADLGVIARSRASHLLDLEIVQQRLLRAPDRVSRHPESGLTRTLDDCESVPLTPAGPQVRLVVATHATTGSSPAVGVERDGMVYELFVSTLPSPAFTASDVLDLAPPIVARLKPCWPMKTISRSPTGGTPIPRVARSLPRSSPNGCGTHRPRTGADALPF